MKIALAHKRLGKKGETELDLYRTAIGLIVKDAGIIGAVLLLAADISAFVDIPTRRGFREISSSTSRATATHRMSATYECWFTWYGPCDTCCHHATKGGENYENRNIIFGSLAFHRHTGSA